MNKECLHELVIALYVPGLSCIRECVLCERSGLFEPEHYTKLDHMYVGKWNNQGKNNLKTYDLYRRKE